MPFNVTYNFRPNNEVFVLLSNGDIKKGVVQNNFIKIYGTVGNLTTVLSTRVLLDEDKSGSVVIKETNVFSTFADAFAAYNNQFTPGLTPSITPTVTPTISLTPTQTITPSVTPTQTVTPTISLTPTNTVTPSVTPTQTVTPTVTPSSSG